MGKVRQSNKEDKKVPQSTPKEKRAAKHMKKQEKDIVPFLPRTAHSHGHT